MFVNMSLKNHRDGRQYRDGSVITEISFAATFVYWKYFRTFKLIWSISVCKLLFMSVAILGDKT